MFQKRTGQNDDGAELNETIAATESLRAAGDGSTPKERKKDDEHLSVFWRVFGGTILSMIAIGTVTLYNNLSGGISELRSELNKEREARAGLSKKEDLDTRVKTLYERIRVVEGQRAELEGLRERVTANSTTFDAFKRDHAAALDAVKKDAAAGQEVVKKDAVAALEAIRKDTAGLEVLRQRVTAIEGLKRDVLAMELVKERLASATADLKSIREELAKATQELERNKASDLERKASRDAQAKQLDETLRDLQRGVQECREKLARLEGARPTDPKGAAGELKGPKPAPPDGD